MNENRNAGEHALKIYTMPKSDVWGHRKDHNIKLSLFGTDKTSFVNLIKHFP